MEIRQATMEDLDSIMNLHRKYHIDTISQDDKKDGFVTTNFTQKQLCDLIIKENGVTIGILDGKVVSYAMAASWTFWSEWPLFEYMIEKLPEYTLEGTTLNSENSYQYGPMCVDSSVRGTGVFEQVFNESLKNMSKRYPIMATFINQINGRSYCAHMNKALMKNLGTFQFNNNNYYLLACHTNRNI